MRRRAIVLGGAASALLAATRVGAQQPGRQYRIGVLVPMAGGAASSYLAVVRERLATQGLHNIRLDSRSPEFGRQATMDAARELLSLKPDAILALGQQMASAAAAATNSVPIVFGWLDDPVRSGLVKDLAKPGGNVTGVTNRFYELGIKRLELVREALPSAKRVAVVAGYFDKPLDTLMELARPAADGMGFELIRVEASGHGWETVVRRSLEERADALLVVTPFAHFGLATAADQVVRDCLKQRVPAVFADVETVQRGGLMSYATNLSEDVRRAADLLARVLRGEKSRDLPVDQAARFELAINLKTARAMKLTIPQSLLVRADRVIE